MPSFDIVSDINAHELTNAFDNSKKELARRFDLKDKCEIKLEDKTIFLEVDAEYMLEQVQDIIRSNLIKRKIDSDCMDIQLFFLSGKIFKQEIKMKEGIDQDTAKKIVKSLKSNKMKVQAAIQGEQIRISGKKRDDLQLAIQFIKELGLGLPLQFNNFRD